MVRRFRRAVLMIAMVTMLNATNAVGQDKKEASPPDSKKSVSFYRQVRPILQRHCIGCHQPAKRGGKLLLTTYDGFKKGGENGAGFTPKKPDASVILDYITGENPQMPLNGDPLSKDQIALITQWIQQGAKDDTPEAAKDTITQTNPPQYASSPVITALAYSPDGKLLAVSGFHETLVHKADGSGLLARFVGQAQRIESLSFSPDGSILAAVGGNPSLFGEVQFWDVRKKSLIGSVTVGHDVCYGGAFNHDGSQFAFGSADNRARVITTKDQKQIMRFDAHSDYVLCTTFSLKGDHLISVSRDRSMKLIIVKNAQLVDNITSITPGALKGGLMAVQRHPQKEQVLVGGADGQPKLYKIFRTRKRIIGDDFNQIRSYQKLPGRIYDLQFNKDGSQFVVGASTGMTGSARIYKTGVYDEKLVNNKGSLGQAFQEIASRSKQNMLLHDLKGVGPVFSVAFRPDGKQVAIGGFDGMVRLFDVKTGKLLKAFSPVKVTSTKTVGR